MMAGETRTVSLDTGSVNVLVSAELNGVLDLVCLSCAMVEVVAC